MILNVCVKRSEYLDLAEKAGVNRDEAGIAQEIRIKPKR